MSARVLKLGGALLEDSEALGSVARTVAANPGGFVVVHGGGAALDRRLAAIGQPSEKIDGVRVTTDGAIDEVVATLAGVVNAGLVYALRRFGVRAVGLTLADAGVVQCARVTEPAGLGRVGAVVGGDAPLVRSLLASGWTPVLCSVGADEDGLLNVNADAAAAGVARAVGASELVLLSDVAGVMDASGGLVSALDVSAAEALIDADVVSGGMVVKVRSALEAAVAIGAPVRIAGWRDVRAGTVCGPSKGEQDGSGT